MILGLDISTSITGYTVIDLEGKILRCDAWDMRNKKKFNDHFEKASKTVNINERRGEETNHFAFEWLYRHKSERFFLRPILVPSGVSTGHKRPR